METNNTQHGKSLRVIRNVYLYLVAMIGLITFIMGSVGIINNVFQGYIFKVDEYSYYEPYGMKGDYCSQPDRNEKAEIISTPTAEEIEACRNEQQKQRENARVNNINRQFSIALAQLGVGLPVWLFHWAIIQREYRRKEEDNK
jgi:hypothetical protein